MRDDSECFPNVLQKNRKPCLHLSSPASPPPHSPRSHCQGAPPSTASSPPASPSRPWSGPPSWTASAHPCDLGNDLEPFWKSRVIWKREEYVERSDRSFREVSAPRGPERGEAYANQTYQRVISQGSAKQGFRFFCKTLHYGNILEYLSLWSEVQSLRIQKSKKIQNPY